MKKFWNLYFKIGAAWGSCIAATHAMRSFVNASEVEHPMLHSMLLVLVGGAIWPFDVADTIKRNMKEDK